MRCSRRDEERLTCLKRHGLAIAELVLKFALQHVCNFLARMDVLWRESTWLEIDTNLHSFETRRTEILLHQFGPLDASRLGLCRGKRHRAGQCKRCQ